MKLSGKLIELRFGDDELYKFLLRIVIKMAEEPDYQNDESIFKWDEKSQLYFHARSFSISELGFHSFFS